MFLINAMSFISGSRIEPEAGSASINTFRLSLSSTIEATVADKSPYFPDPIDIDFE
jgi:hypothetical protein